MRNCSIVAARGLLEGIGLRNGFTCTSVCSCVGRQEDMEAASVKEAKEEVNDLALQHGDWRKWVRGSEGQQLLD